MRSVGCVESITELLKNLLRSIICEECCGLCQLWVVWLHVQLNVSRILGFFFGKLFTHVYVVSNLLTSTRPLLCLVLHGHFFVFFFGGTCLVNLVTLGEFQHDFFNRGNFSLQPRVSNDVSHAETLMRVELKHACDQVLKLIREKACSLSI